MSYDKSQWTASLGAKMRQRTQDMLPALRMMQGQAQPMESLLTQHDYWNRYLAFLQELVNRTKASKEAAMARMQDPSIWDPQQLAKLKSDVLTADGMIAAWDVAMKLPKALIEDAVKASELIEQFGKENGEEHATAVEPQP